MKMQVFAPAKINWALSVEGLREDGYHLLDMLMQTISLGDDLTFEQAEGLSLFVNGRTVKDPERNLVMRAAEALNAYAGTQNGAKMSLVKRIPARAGLGGGSADCAAALLALNEMWGLRIMPRELQKIGLSLGADVPFCMTGGLARVRGIGEQIEELSFNKKQYLVILHPGGGLSTRDVFARYDATAPSPIRIDISALYDALMRQDFEGMRRYSKNALLSPALRLMPEIGNAFEKLYESGAAFVQMSGSGSAVYGVFEDERRAKHACEKISGLMATT